MRLFRRLFRLLKIYIWFWGMGLYVWLINREKGWDAVARAAHFTRIWAAQSAKIIDLKVRVEGSKDGFPGGLIVCNHQGYLDILVNASLFEIRFAPKSEMLRWPFLGKLVGLNRPVWIDRSSRQKSRHAAEEMVETMKHHISMLVYPEGTSTDGERLLPFKSTPFEAACEVGLPILPVLLRYSSTPADGDGGPLAWHGSDLLLPHIWRILGLKEICADVKILPVVYPIEGESRKELAARVHDLMETEFFEGSKKNDKMV